MLPSNSGGADGAERFKKAFQDVGKIAPQTHDDLTYNQRVKYVQEPDGGYRFLECMTFSAPVFNPGNVERLRAPAPEPDAPRVSRSLLQNMDAEDLAFLCASFGEPNTASREQIRARLDAALDEDAGAWLEYLLDHGIDLEGKQRAENAKRAARRARRKVGDYIMAEYDLRYFITLTLNGDDFPRDDINGACKKLNNWLRNRVQRDGLKYVIVPELHKDGRCIHFHGFINDALRLVDSGTMIPPEGGRPIKRETARRKGLDPALCHTVYNIPDWLYGFTTAIEIYGDRAAAAAYLCKYITKQYTESQKWDSTSSRTKIAGRYYWHSNNLREPLVKYNNVPWEQAAGREYDTPAGQMRIVWPDPKTPKTAQNIDTFEEICAKTPEKGEK